MTKKKEKPKSVGAELHKVAHNVKHYFSEGELIDLSAEQNADLRKLKEVREEKKVISAEYSNHEKELEARIYRYHNQIQGGYEKREKPCFIFYGKNSVYWFLCEDLAKIKPADFNSTDDLLEFLLADESFTPVDSREILPHERQRDLFKDGQNKAGTAPAETVQNDKGIEVKVE